mgnify:CR=1 FL=1
MNRTFLAFNGTENQADRLRGSRDRMGRLTLRHFPDGESWLQVDDPVEGRDVVVVARLDRPDRQLVALHLLASTLRSMGAAGCTLVAPYMPYMRQDLQRSPGEVQANRIIGAMLSRDWDHVVTVDPHLHRVERLDELFSCRTSVVAAAPAIARWLQQEHPDAVIAGPDAESAQWVRPVAELMGRPWLCLDKERHGDRDVTVRGFGDADAGSGANAALAREEQQRGGTIRPEELAGAEVIVLDDIISTGVTLTRAAQALEEQGARIAGAIGIHAVFAAGAIEALDRFPRVVTCNTLLHSSNRIDVLGEIHRVLLPEVSNGGNGGGGGGGGGGGVAR